MASYSDFFSSGLLAPLFIDTKTPFLNSEHLLPSPSPLSEAYDDASDIEVEMNAGLTPVPSSPATTRASSFADAPRLRKRKSSISVAAAAPLMTSIKSPSRSATSAYQFQRHLQTSPSRASRSRSGSLVVNTNIASEGTSLVGRLRSGSASSLTFRPRRPIRRINPALPPPTAPLPAVPSDGGPSLSLATPKWLAMPHSAPPQHFNFADRFPLGQRPQHLTASSVSYGSFSGRIDEAMKEN